MIIPNWQAPANIKALTLGKEQSDSLKSLLPTSIVWLNQVHGTDCCRATKEQAENFKASYIKHQLNKLDNSYIQTLVNADSSYNNISGVACAVKTADCLPIILTNEQGDWVCAIHAGWRGLVSGIIEKTIHTLKSNLDNKLAASSIIAWIGPAICMKHFAIRADAYEIILKYVNMYTAESSRTFNAEHIRPVANSLESSQWQVDLPAIAGLVLSQLGVQNIFNSKLCTYCQPELFYSYRRDGADAGRLITMIWKE